MCAEPDNGMSIATRTDESAEKEASPPPGRILINRRQCRQKVPLCDRTILDMEKRGAFPRRFLIGKNVVVWDLHEVEAWIERQQSEGMQSRPPGSRSAGAEEVCESQACSRKG